MWSLLCLSSWGKWFCKPANIRAWMALWLLSMGTHEKIHLAFPSKAWAPVGRDHCWGQWWFCSYSLLCLLYNYDLIKKGKPTRLGIEPSYSSNKFSAAQSFVGCCNCK